MKIDGFRQLEVDETIGPEDFYVTGGGGKDDFNYVHDSWEGRTVESILNQYKTADVRIYRKEFRCKSKPLPLP